MARLLTYDGQVIDPTAYIYIYVYIWQRPQNMDPSPPFWSQHLQTTQITFYIIRKKFDPNFY